MESIFSAVNAHIRRHTGGVKLGMVLCNIFLWGWYRVTYFVGMLLCNIFIVGMVLCNIFLWGWYYVHFFVGMLLCKLDKGAAN